MAKRCHVHITGKVQGVWFRESTRQEADRLGVKGWVQNLPDGRVEGVFEGPDEAVDALVTWCHTGPSNARVDQVQVDAQDATGEFTQFQVLR